MLRNRSVQMKFVNDRTNPIEAPPPVDYAEVARETSNGVTKIMLTYIAADTARKVLLQATGAIFR